MVKKQQQTGSSHSRSHRTRRTCGRIDPGQGDRPVRNRPAERKLRDYFDLMTIEQRTDRTVDEGLALFLERFQPEFPDQALNHIVLGPGYLNDVDPDDALPVSRQQIVDYWTRRQPEIIAARGR